MDRGDPLFIYGILTFCGDINIHIDRSGQWFYQNSPIGRERLVKLFASVLTAENDEYFLITPVEKMRITVDDAPFVITVADQLFDDEGIPYIHMHTNLGDECILGGDTQLHVQHNLETGEPRPYVNLWRGMKALVSRSVFYQLVNWAEEQDGQVYIHSAGHKFSLGYVEG